MPQLYFLKANHIQRGAVEFASDGGQSDLRIPYKGDAKAVERNQI